MKDNTVRLHDFIHAYIDDEGFGCFSWEQRAHTTEYVRSNIAQEWLAAVRKEYTEDLPALLAMVGCATVEELAGQYRSLCAKVVFGQIDGATIGKAEEVLQKWNGDV